jgi:hypothetical protein
MTINQSSSDLKEIEKALKQISINAQRRIDISKDGLRQRSMQEAVDWINSWDANLDLACCWHAYHALRDIQKGDNEQWLQRHLSSYFNVVHKITFKHIPKQQRPQIPRFITLEHSPNVGWHAHGILATPSHLTLEEFSEILRKQWLKEMKSPENGKFSKRLCWFMPLASGYKHYMLKSVFSNVPAAQKNCVGFIDDHNSYRP